MPNLGNVEMGLQMLPMPDGSNSDSTNSSSAENIATVGSTDWDADEEHR